MAKSCVAAMASREIPPLMIKATTMVVAMASREIPPLMIKAATMVVGPARCGGGGWWLAACSAVVRLSLSLSPKGIEQGIAEEFSGEGTLVSSVSDFTSFPVDVNAVDDGQEQNASPSGRGEDIPKVAKTNILPSAHKVLEKKPKKGLLQQKKREILDRDIFESGEEKSISGVDEDDERIDPAEDEKYVGGEVDPKVPKVGFMLGAPKVFDKRPLPKPEDHIKRAEVKQDQDPDVFNFLCSGAKLLSIKSVMEQTMFSISHHGFTEHVKLLMLKGSVASAL
ncbi:hypothetical protein U1Q18_032134 [Sarracenia purpurea var. burkii]